MEEITKKECLDAYEKVRHEVQLPDSLFDWQADVICTLINEVDSVAIYPTGSGKSLLFSLVPLLLDQLDPSAGPHMAVVISPLISLMHDQMRQSLDCGIQAITLRPKEEMKSDHIEGIKQCKYSLIYTSPECGEIWSDLLKCVKNNICLVAFDEVHCMVLWETFRESYNNIWMLDSKVPAPKLLMSATVTVDMLSNITSKFHMSPESFSVSGILPDRKNIFLEYVNARNITALRWVVDHIVKEGKNMPKTVIFCPSITQVGRLYDYIVGSVVLQKPGGNWVEDKPQGLQSQIVLQFHRGLTDETRDFVLSTYPSEESIGRVVICTVAFGMGINIPDIQNVVHWGLSSTVCHYWQEVGRGGRNIHKAKAILYPGPRMDPKVTDPLFIELIKNHHSSATCLRYDILKSFQFEGIDCSVLTELTQREQCEKRDCLVCECSLCVCCQACSAKCECNNWTLNHIMEN